MDDRALAAVQAHLLLGDVSVLRLAAVSLATSWHALDATDREELRRMLIERRALVRSRLRRLPADDAAVLATDYASLSELVELLIAGEAGAADDDDRVRALVADIRARCHDEGLRSLAHGLPVSAE
jgi:hypothetical protein